MTDEVIYPKIQPDSLHPDFDAAGLAVEMQNMLPEPHLLPLFYLNLKIEQDTLKHEFAKLVSFLNAKGLDYE